MDNPDSRAAAARARAAEAAEAAARARARVERRQSSETVAEAQESRVRAEERLAAVRAELSGSLARSRKAHLSAARLHAERGDQVGAARHRAAAEEDHRRQEDVED